MPKVTGILAIVVAAFLAARPVAAQSFGATATPASRSVEVFGGEGDKRWTIQYGTSWNSRADETVLAAESHGIGYFGHEQWLRTFDLTRGVVSGRWRFPCPITKIEPDGPGVRVQLKCVESEAPSTPTFLFDPSAPKVPDWPYGGLLLLRVSELEAIPLVTATPREASGSLMPGFVCAPRRAVDTPHELKDAAVRAVARDPLSPFLRIALGRILQAVSDPRAAEVFDAAAEAGSGDFYELFRLSACLETLGQSKAAARAFDRAYRNYLERGYDPRLFTFLISRLVLYPTFSSAHGLTAESRPDLIEQMYRLTPRGEGAATSWRMFAEWLDRRGRSDEARVWRARADDARAHSVVLTGDVLVPAVDELIIVLASAVAACLLTVVVLYVKYRPQRRLALAIDAQQNRIVRRLGLVNLEYWSRRERVGFLACAAIAWYATGVCAGYVRAAGAEASTPIAMSFGSFGGDTARVFLERRAATPARDLLLALAHQHSGRSDTAERLYRGLPQYPEAWNNLGVLLHDRGNRDEAKQAFERALQLNPSLVEAKRNLGQPVEDIWADQHRRVLPDRMMMAVPTPGQMLETLRGESTAAMLLQALLGPFSGVQPPGRNISPMFDLARIAGINIPRRSAGVIIAVALVAGLVLVVGTIGFFARPRDVTEAPGSAYRWLVAIVPGASPLWGAFGPCVLAATVYVALQLWLRWQFTSARLLTLKAMPGVTRAYGLSGAWEIENPFPLLLYAGAFMILVLHVVAIRRAHLRAARSGGPART